MIPASIIQFPLQQPVAIFLLVLVIILFAPLILNRLKVPYIIGMIVAGMAIGPYGFNLLARDASFEIFGQVGILYLMFLAAVEIDMYNLKLNSSRGILFGLITFAVPFALGLAACRYLLNAGWVTSALIASMFSSHTLISYPIINRFGLSSRSSVIVAVFSTIVSVLLALITLAGVVAVSTTGKVDTLFGLRLLWMIVVYGLVIGITFPWITRRFFRKVADPVAQFIYVLAMVFVASLLAQLIGLEAILGAFFAGLVLNRFIPSRSALMNRIEFVGNAIFIPYFLIGVGMLINVGVIIRGWNVLYVAVVMVATALGGKWLSAWIAQKSFGYSKVGRNILFGLTSGKAAATIAATMVGYNYHLLNEDMMNGAVLMILICCAVASVTTERAAVKLRMRLTKEDLLQEAKKEQHNARQLVAVSNPVTAEGLMKLAVLLRHDRNRLPVTVLFVRNSDDNKKMAMGREAMHKASDVATDVGLEVNEVERYDLNTVSGLVNTIKEKDASEIVLGLHRRSNIVDTFYGSMTEQLIASTNRMVLITRMFVPVNTLSRLVVIVPDKAQYETGFRLWVERIGNLARQLSCEARFITYHETGNYIRGVIEAGRYMIDYEISELETWDDFITLSHDIEDEDLLVVVGARRTSISFTSDLEALPQYLSKYFASQNLMVIYPEQFGDSEEMPTPIDSVAQSITTNPTPLLLSWRRWRGIHKPTQRRDLD